MVVCMYIAVTELNPIVKHTARCFTIYECIVFALWLSCSETKIGGLASYNAHFERCASSRRNTFSVFSILSLCLFVRLSYFNEIQPFSTVRLWKVKLNLFSRGFPSKSACLLIRDRWMKSIESIDFWGADKKWGIHRQSFTQTKTLCVTVVESCLDLLTTVLEFSYCTFHFALVCIVEQLQQRQ